MIEQGYAHLSPEFKNSEMDKFTPKRRSVCFGRLNLRLGTGNGTLIRRASAQNEDDAMKMGLGFDILPFLEQDKWR